MPQIHKGARIQHTVRLPASLHREVIALARQRRLSLNEWITMAVEEAVEARRPNPTPPPASTRPSANVYDDDGNVIGQI